MEVQGLMKVVLCSHDYCSNYLHWPNIEDDECDDKNRMVMEEEVELIHVFSSGEVQVDDFQLLFEMTIETMQQWFLLGFYWY